MVARTLGVSRLFAAARERSSLQVASAISLGAVGYSVYLGLPVILGALSESLALSEQQVGWIASGELLGLTAGSVMASRLLGVWRFRRLVWTAMLMAVAMNVATANASGFESILVLRVLAGFAGGACYSLSLASLSWCGDPTRNSSWLGVGLITLGSLELAVLPWANSHFGMSGVFMLLALMYVVPMLMSRHLPREPAIEVPASGAAEADDAAAIGAIKWIGLACLAAIALYNVGVTSFWAYVAHLGETAGLTGEFVSLTLNLSNLATLATCYVAVLAARRCQVQGPMVVGLLCVAAMLATWPIQALPLDFGVRAFLFFQILTLCQIYQLSILTMLDRTGRLAALLPAAQGVGQCLGPLAGGLVFAAGFGFRQQLVLEALCLAGAAAIFAAAFLSTRASVGSTPQRGAL